MYQVAFRSAPDGAATVAYQHVLKESKQQPPSDTSSVPAAAAAAAAADRLAEDADQVQSASTRRLLLEDSVVVVGKGGGGVVYLLQQQEPHCLDYPQQVALKLAWAGSSGSHDNEEKVLSALRPDLPHVAHLLGTAQGSSAGEAVRGLVYEYYSGGDLHCWVLATTRQAAQEPDMQQQCPEAAEAHMPESGPPDEQLAFKSFVDKVGVRGGVMAPLRKLVLEQPLKRMMRGLLELLVQISSPTTSSSSSSNQQHKGGSSDGHNSSSSSSHDDSSSKSCHGSATNPPGVVIHGDVKPQNIYVGSTGRAVLGDWGSALYSPSPKQLKMKHMPFTFR
jgi:serine/threonine protein kinase